MNAKKSSMRRHARSLISALLLMVGAVQAHGSDTYDPATKQVTIPSIIIGNATYSNMVVTVGKIVSGPTGSAPTSTGDFFNPANNQLAIPVVTYGA